VPIGVTCPTCGSVLEAGPDPTGRPPHCANCSRPAPAHVSPAAGAGESTQPDGFRPARGSGGDDGWLGKPGGILTGPAATWLVVVCVLASAGVGILTFAALPVGAARAKPGPAAGAEPAAAADDSSPLHDLISARPDPEAPAGSDHPPGDVKWSGARTTAGLVGKYRDRVILEANSERPGTHSVRAAFDGDDETVWLSQGEGTRGGDPWVKVTFPEPVTVTRVTVRGNHDPDNHGTAVESATIALLDAAGKVIESRDLSAVGNDFLFTPPSPVGGVRGVKFTSTREEGPGRTAAVSELVVE